MVSASMSVCVFVSRHTSLSLSRSRSLSCTFSSRSQSVRHGGVILTRCKSLSCTADKSRLLSSLCAVLEAEARCLHATSTHGQCPSIGRTQAGKLLPKLYFSFYYKIQMDIETIKMSFPMSSRSRLLRTQTPIVHSGA